MCLRARRKIHVGNSFIIYIIKEKLALLHKDSRRCVTGVMHECSFMQNVYLLLILNKYILHRLAEDDRD